mmetsp:Transcript_60672/g.188099  ORF Transcript_60672/g.188099 Transcript_60672/m.188099 type:complete len:203 (-) Transcript_60672:19-627(-)
MHDGFRVGHRALGVEKHLEQRLHAAQEASQTRAQLHTEEPMLPQGQHRGVQRVGIRGRMEPRPQFGRGQEGVVDVEHEDQLPVADEGLPGVPLHLPEHRSGHPQVIARCDEAGPPVGRRRRVLLAGALAVAGLLPALGTQPGKDHTVLARRSRGRLRGDSRGRGGGRRLRHAAQSARSAPPSRRLLGGGGIPKPRPSGSAAG